MHCDVGLDQHTEQSNALSLMQCTCEFTKSMPSREAKFSITPLLMHYPIYKHHALGPKALGLGACKSDIVLTVV